jgi:molybdenum cofactor cytidylyltransferase
MGPLKQLLPINDRPAVRLCVETILSSDVRDITAVVRPGAENVVSALGGFAVKIACNERAECEMADSVRTGLRFVDSGSTGVLVCLADHPLVSRETLKALVKAHSTDPEKIIIPVYDGKRGHPAMFPGSILKEIFSATSLRDIITKDPARVLLLAVPDEGVILDMDTMEDYREILKKAGGPHGKE